MALSWRFTLPCEKSGDFNDDSRLDISDPIFGLNSMFLGGSPLPEPHPEAGVDPTPDALTCELYAPIPPEETGDLVYLGDVDAVAGATVAIPVYVSSAEESEAYQLLLTYDPSVVEDVIAYDFSNTFYAEFGDTPGFHSIQAHEESGVITVGWIGSFTEEGFGVPAGEDVLAGEIVVQIAANEPEGAVPIELISRKGESTPRSPSKARS